LSFGSHSPIFEILEIGDLGKDKFRGIFKLKYDGDAHITLSTSIQANLLRIHQQVVKEVGGAFALPKFGLSSESFSMPLFVDLRDIRLSGIIVVVFSKSKGLTLVFKNDPLENIKVSSSFDNVQVIERFLQTKIENQVRDLFRDILPSVLHKVSQKWTTSHIFNQLHSKIHDQQQSNEKISIFDVNPLEPELSPANMLKLSTLNTARQSFRLSIEPFQDVVERPSLFKFDGEQMGYCKNIPIEIITKGYKLDDTLVKLSKYQYKNYLSEKNTQKLKRRSIKLGKTKQLKSPRSVSMNTECTMNTETTLVDKEDVEESISQEKSRPLQYSPIRAIPTPLQEPISPMLEKLQLFPLSQDMIPRCHSPRKSQSNLLNFGPGLHHWSDSPPPYHYH
jgi:distribution and morphology protein 34